jgi:hypothetical protein
MNAQGHEIGLGQAVDNRIVQTFEGLLFEFPNLNVGCKFILNLPIALRSEVETTMLLPASVWERKHE